MMRGSGSGGTAVGLLVALIGILIIVFLVIMSSSVGCFAWMFSGRFGG